MSRALRLLLTSLSAIALGAVAGRLALLFGVNGPDAGVTAILAAILCFRIIQAERADREE